MWYSSDAGETEYPLDSDLSFFYRMLLKIICLHHPVPDPYKLLKKQKIHEIESIVFVVTVDL